MQEQLTAEAKRIAELEHQVTRLTKINDALKDRVKRSIRSAADSFSVFENNILLQKEIDRQTHSLKKAKKTAEAATRAKAAAMRSSYSSWCGRRAHG